MSILNDFKGLPKTWFIETGTGEGETLANAAMQCEYCFSVEQNLELYCAATRRFADYPNVFVFHGESTAWLRELLTGESIYGQESDRLNGDGCTFWLDAHSCGESAGRTAGPGKECPLLDELKVLTSKAWNTLPTILIDDAPMFTEAWWEDWRDSEGDKIFKFNRSAWPTVEEIDALLPLHCRTMRDNGGILQYTPHSMNS